MRMPNCGWKKLRLLRRVLREHLAHAGGNFVAVRLLGAHLADTRPAPETPAGFRINKIDDQRALHVLTLLYLVSHERAVIVVAAAARRILHFGRAILPLVVFLYARFVGRR